MADFEFFKKEFEFKGKHARMVSELWYSNDSQNTYFRRLIDLYRIAAVVGFRADRKSPEDYSPVEPKSIFPEQMIGAKEELDYLMQMMVMLDNKGNMSDEECVKTAFRGPQTKEEYLRLKEMFESYVRGGVEVIYEQLILRAKPESSEMYSGKAENIKALYERFSG